MKVAAKSSLRAMAQDARQDVAACQGALAVALTGLLASATPQHIAKLARQWLLQTVAEFPWLRCKSLKVTIHSQVAAINACVLVGIQKNSIRHRWHTALSTQLAEVWDTDKGAQQGGKQHDAPAAAVLRQVRLPEFMPWGSVGKSTKDLRESCADPRLLVSPVAAQHPHPSHQE